MEFRGVKVRCCLSPAYRILFRQPFVCSKDQIANKRLMRLMK